MVKLAQNDTWGNMGNIWLVKSVGASAKRKWISKTRKDYIMSMKQ